MRFLFCAGSRYVSILGSLNSESVVRRSGANNRDHLDGGVQNRHSLCRVRARHANQMAAALRQCSARISMNAQHLGIFRPYRMPAQSGLMSGDLPTL